MSEVRSSTRRDRLHWVDRHRGIVPTQVAELLIRRALHASPGDVVNRRRLGDLLYKASRWDDAIEAMAPAVQTDATCAHLCGLASLAARRYDQAVEVLERARHLDRDGKLSDLAEAIAHRDGRAAADPLCRAALATDPHDVQALAMETVELLATGRGRDLEDLCADLARRGVKHAGLQAARAGARAMRGDHAGVAEIIDYELVSVARLDAAAGLPHDHDRLSDEILGHPHRAEPNPRRAARGGSRVEGLVVPSAVTLAALGETIRARVDAYVDWLAHEAPGAPLPLPSGDVALDMWAVIFRGDEHETRHVHPSALVSGVYYVCMPPRPDGGRAGALEFGLLGDHADAAANPAASWRHTLDPVPGLLVLFPSSYGHRTIPTGRSELRISVAFDVVPG